MQEGVLFYPDGFGTFFLLVKKKRSYLMSKACTKDDVCKFFDFQVNDHSKWTDKCGSDRFLGKTCKMACCNQQNEHCFKSQTAAYRTMRFFNQCMGERGCQDEATCDSFFATGTASDGRSKTSSSTTTWTRKTVTHCVAMGGTEGKSARRSVVLPRWIWDFFFIG